MLFQAKEYQKWFSHLDRDLEFATEIEKMQGLDTIGKIQQIFYDAIELKKEFSFEGNDFKIKREELEWEDFGTKSGNRLRCSLIKYRKYIFTFLYCENVPFHNNGSQVRY